MRVKHLILLTLLLLFALVNLSCNAGKETKPAQTSKTKTPFSFRITWPDYSGRGEAIQKIVRVYNEKPNASVRVTVTGGDEDLAALEKMLRSGESRTIYVLPYRYVQYFGDKGALADLSIYYAGQKNVFYPALWKLGQVDGKTYGVPWLGHSMCLIYNKNLLNKAGVDASSIRSLATLVRAMEIVEAKTGTKGIGLVGANHNDVSWMVNQFLFGYGSTLVNPDGTAVTINNPKSKAALAFYKNVLGKHAQPSWVNDSGVEVMDHFRKQEVAFEIQGPWGVTDIDKSGRPFEVGILALGDIGLPSEVGPMMLALPTNMKAADQAAAREFIDFLVSRPAQERIMDGEYSPEHDAYYPFRLPARKDLLDSVVFVQYPEYRPFLLGFKQPSVDVPVPAWQTVKDKYYAPGLHRLMKGEISIDEFLISIEREGNTVLAAHRKRDAAGEDE
ncbi:MAG: ABC transporter substrate-binding protein [Solirubrobacterales bacterium]